MIAWYLIDPDGDKHLFFTKKDALEYLSDHFEAKDRKFIKIIKLVAVEQGSEE